MMRLAWLSKKGYRWMRVCNAWRIDGASCESEGGTFPFRYVFDPVLGDVYRHEPLDRVFNRGICPAHDCSQWVRNRFALLLLACMSRYLPAQVVCQAAGSTRLGAGGGQRGEPSSNAMRLKT